MTTVHGAGHQVVVVEVDDVAAPRLQPDRPSLYVTTTAGSAAARVAQLLAGTRGPDEIRGTSSATGRTCTPSSRPPPPDTSTSSASG